MKYTLYLVPLLLFLFSCSEIKEDTQNPFVNDNGSKNDDQMQIKTVNSKDSSGFEFQVNYLEFDTLVYSTNYIYVGNNNDPNYGNLSLYSAIRLVPYNNDYNSNYEIEDVKKILGAHLKLYGYSNSFDKDSSKTLDIQLLELSKLTSFSTLTLKMVPETNPVPVGDTSFSNNVRGYFNIPITDTNFVRKVLKYNSKSSTSTDYDNNIFGFLIKANNTFTSKTQGFYGYGSSYEPTMVFDIIVEKDGVQDTIVADFTIEASNQLSSFVKLGDWNLNTPQSKDKVKIVNFSGIRAKISFNTKKIIPTTASIYSGTFSISADTLISSWSNSNLLRWYGSTSTNGFVSPTDTRGLSDGSYKFYINSWIQFWSLNDINNGFLLVSPYESTSVENFTLNLNSIDPLKKANLEIIYSERPVKK